MTGFAFPKKERLLSRPEFLQFNSGGNKMHTAHFIVLWNDSGTAGTRLGVTVSRKVGNAVIRNRIKRRLREFYRHNKPLFIEADFNIIAKRGAEGLDSQQVSIELAAALGRLRERYAQ
ncbi:ribonuclease P protein component [Geomonas sp. RF6]|uniref:ribonuclease P protein component n=1 Tax=Geomonas sp. RF6 TaxID=2897342 RepID=UPI001E2E9179|nr:ribonuclease P protein component [Geomonas sp. RF6]UFS72183.1 ribonuclease P protein component [Geomonas sp. RF6]